MVIKVSCKDYNNAEGEVKYFSETGNAIGYYDELIEKYKPELVEETDIKDFSQFQLPQPHPSGYQPHRDGTDK